MDVDWLLTEEDVNTALGVEVRRAREAAGLSRPELVALLPFKIAVATLLNWEHGHRSISYARLVEVGRTLHTSAPELLRRAIAHVELIQSLWVEVDLRPLCDDTDPRFALLRTWAENKLAHSDDTTSVVRVHHSVIRELAVLLHVGLPELVKYIGNTTSFVQIIGQGTNSSDADERGSNEGKLP